MPILILQGETERRNGIHYEVDPSVTPLGEGGMGRVYQGIAVDETTGSTRPVAIKFMFPDLPAQAYERARREASIRLRNDNLIEMLGFVELAAGRATALSGYQCYVVSELLDGVSLEDLLEGRTTDRHGQSVPLAEKLLHDYRNDPSRFARTVVVSVLSGLMALHDAGYIHRDIDPSNIFVTTDGRIKLIDFGIAKQMNTLTTGDRQLTVAGKFMGKAQYAAPELALGDVRHQNQTTDIYAVGILLYQCLVGHTPFEGAYHEVLDRQINEKLPLQVIRDKELRRIIATACDKNQARRYQTAAQMRVALELSASSAGQGASGRWPLWLAAGGAAAAVVVGGLLLVHGLSGDKEEALPPVASLTGVTASAPGTTLPTDSFAIAEQMEEEDTTEMTDAAAEQDTDEQAPESQEPQEAEHDKDEPKPQHEATTIEETVPAAHTVEPEAPVATEAPDVRKSGGFKLQRIPQRETAKATPETVIGVVSFKKNDDGFEKAKKVTVGEGCTWTLSETPEWVEVRRPGEDGFFWVVPKKNGTGTDREGVIHLRVDGKPAAVRVRQKG